MAAHGPEQPQSPGEPEPEFGLPAFAREGKGGPEVVVLGFEPVHPRYLLRSDQLRLRFLGEGEEVLGVRLFDLPGLAALLELLPGVLVDGLEHHEAGFVLGTLFLPEEALARDGGSSPSARAKALLGAGDMALRQGDYERAEQSLEESLALFRESGDEKGEARSLRSLGKCVSDRHDLDRASELLSESARISRRSGDESELAQVLSSLGVLAIYRKDTVRATTLYEEAQGLARAAGNIFALAGSQATSV